MQGLIEAPPSESANPHRRRSRRTAPGRIEATTAECVVEVPWVGRSRRTCRAALKLPSRRPNYTWLPGRSRWAHRAALERARGGGV